MVYNVWSEIQQAVVEQSSPKGTGTLELSALSIPILVTLFLALLLTSIAIFGQTNTPKIDSSGKPFFKKGNERSYGLLIAATVFAFLGLIMSPINLFSSGFSSLVSLGKSSQVTAMWLNFGGVFLCFVAAIILAVVATPYNFTPEYRQNLAKYGGFGILLLSFLSLLTSYILQKVDAPQGVVSDQTETQGEIKSPGGSDAQTQRPSGSQKENFSNTAVFPAEIDRQMQVIPLDQFKTMIRSMFQTQSASTSAVSTLVQHMRNWPASATNKDAKIEFIVNFFRSPQ